MFLMLWGGRIYTEEVSAETEDTVLFGGTSAEGTRSSSNDITEPVNGLPRLNVYVDESEETMDHLELTSQTSRGNPCSEL